jgi:hypothetical protein
VEPTLAEEADVAVEIPPAIVSPEPTAEEVASAVQEGAEEGESVMRTHQLPNW